MTRIKECRIKSGLSQKRVAMELGVKPPSVSDWESGKTNPSMGNLKLLAELYGVTTDYLLGLDKEDVVMNRIRELRKKKGLTMKALGAIFSFSESTISLYENGKRSPDIETMQKFADFFGVTVDYLIGREEAQQKTPADPMQEKRAHLVSLLMQFTDEEIQRFEDFAAGVLASRK